MAKQLLIETKMGALSLQEGIKSNHPNCLGVIKGPCADYDSPTRNGNFYSRKLWENVFKDPLVKEALEDRVLIGELDHPESRLETKATNACILMTDYEFDDNNKTVVGTFEILPTPQGKILRSLLDCGCKIGVSSRGEGDVSEDSQGRNVVAEDGSYYFVAFDAVVLPAVKKAKPALQESLQKRQTLKESVEAQINEATTKNELELIKKVLEATELPDLDSLLESIDIKSKELEGSNSPSNLMEDVERLTASVTQLTGENKRLSQEVTDRKSRGERVTESCKKLYNQYSQKSKEFDKLSEDYSDMSFKFNQVSQKVDSLTESLKSLKEENSTLTEEISQMRDQVSSQKKEISYLEESLERSQSLVREKSKKIKELTEAISETKSEMSQRLQESKDREKQARKSVESMKSSLKESKSQNQQAIKAYANKRAVDLGLDPKTILESVNPTMTTSDVDKLLSEELDRSDRYRKLSFVSDPVISSLSEGKVSIKSNAPIDEDDVQTTTFMEQYYKLK